MRTGLLGDTGETGREGEVEKEVEGDSASRESPSASVVRAALLPAPLAEKESMPHPGAPGQDEALLWESSFDSLLPRSPSFRLPSPQRSVSREGEEGADDGGWCFLDFLLASLKLARGGRRRTPLRVEPSMAFCNC